jgi:hypothetical protein
MRAGKRLPSTSILTFMKSQSLPIPQALAIVTVLVLDFSRLVLSVMPTTIVVLGIVKWLLGACRGACRPVI